MKERLSKIFICPKCKTSLGLKIIKKNNKRIEEGFFLCPKCDIQYKIIDDIVCFKEIKSTDKNEKKIQSMKDLFLNYEYKKEWHKHFSKEELSTLKKEIQFLINNLDLGESRIHLDWATGTGRFLRNILDKVNGEIIALDFGFANCVALKAFLKKLKKYSKVTILCADARNIPIINNTIDSISSWHGLDEPKIEKAITESKRVLMKNKRAAFSGVFYEKSSESLKLSKKFGINFAEEDKAYNYFKKVDFKDIKYKKFLKVKEKSKKNFVPKYGDYWTVYTISGKK